MFLRLTNALLKGRLLGTLPSIFFKNLIFGDVKVRTLHFFVLLLLMLVKLLAGFLCCFNPFQYLLPFSKFPKTK